MVRAHLELSHELRPTEWTARYERGEVPDYWPYGLDRLARHDIQPVLRAPLTGRVAGRVGDAVRNRLGGLEWLDCAATLFTDRYRSADAVFCWDERTGVPAVLRERAFGHRPVITGVVWLTDGYQVDPLAARAARRALPRAALVFASSRAMIKPLVSDWGVPASRARHIPLGVDTEFFRPNSGVARPGLVVSAGNDRHRDHSLLVRAMRTVRRRIPEARLEIATRIAVEVEPAAGRVWSSLNERQVGDLYTRASVVALATTPNRHASGLTVTLEAMACGRPVVVPDNPGLAEYVLPERTGLVYPVGDEDALAKCVERLLNDQAAAEAMGEAGRRRAEELFSTEIQAARLADEMLHL